MSLVVTLLLLAIVFGGVGLLVETLPWTLVLALALLIAGAVTGLAGRDRID